MAKRVTLRRVIGYGWTSFVRNGWLSTATILVMTLTLFMIGGLLLVSVVANTILTDLENKIDISVSFKTGTNEATIASIKNALEGRTDVKDVSYVSANEALANFKEIHKNDPNVIASLIELGDMNPLLATLNIKAKNPSDFSAIAGFLDQENYPSIALDANGNKKITYFQNQKAIDHLSAIVRGVRSVGIVMILILGFEAILVAFNTVRLAIYTAREEINIMKLVGATNWYVRGPFMIEGILHGVGAAIITALVFFPIIWVSSPKLIQYGVGVDLQSYFTQNFFQFLLILATVGIVLGTASSFFAIRRYLKI